MPSLKGASDSGLEKWYWDSGRLLLCPPSLLLGRERWVQGLIAMGAWGGGVGRSEGDDGSVVIPTFSLTVFDWEIFKLQSHFRVNGIRESPRRVISLITLEGKLWAQFPWIPPPKSKLGGVLTPFPPTRYTEESFLLVFLSLSETHSFVYFTNSHPCLFFFLPLIS